MEKILVVAFVILVLFCGAVSAQDNIEKKKIEFLLSSVENLKGAKFIRNSSEYNDGKAAADHLRMKLKTLVVGFKTAVDFIRLCASQTIFNGKTLVQIILWKDHKIRRIFSGKTKGII